MELQDRIRRLTLTAADPCCTLDEHIVPLACRCESVEEFLLELTRYRDALAADWRVLSRPVDQDASEIILGVHMRRCGANRSLAQDALDNLLADVESVPHLVHRLKLTVDVADEILSTMAQP